MMINLPINNHHKTLMLPLKPSQGCQDYTCWQDLNQSMERSIRGIGCPRGLLAANNLYDARYIRHFTGLTPVVIPNYCSYISENW